MAWTHIYQYSLNTHSWTEAPFHIEDSPHLAFLLPFSWVPSSHLRNHQRWSIPWCIPSAMYTHIHNLARRAWLMTQPQTPATDACVVLAVPQRSQRCRPLPAVSRTCTEGILFTELGKDQSSRTLIVTMYNFPPPPLWFTSYSFSVYEIWAF